MKKKSPWLQWRNVLRRSYKAHKKLTRAREEFHQLDVDRAAWFNEWLGKLRDTAFGGPQHYHIHIGPAQMKPKDWPYPLAGMVIEVSEPYLSEAPGVYVVKSADSEYLTDVLLRTIGLDGLAQDQYIWFPRRHQRILTRREMGLNEEA